MEEVEEEENKEQIIKKEEITKDNPNDNTIHEKNLEKKTEIEQKIDNTNEKNNIINEEKNILTTKSRKCETNSSTNQNKDIIKNMNNINELILNNYLNTINVGYNGLTEINNFNNLDIENDENLLIGDKNIECEPTPSFILCIKKMSNA